MRNSSMILNNMGNIILINERSQISTYITNKSPELNWIN